MITFQKLCGPDNWPANDGGVPCAVRWALREVRGENQWSRWHYTEGNGLHTACGRPVQLMTADDSPQAQDLAQVDCRSCLEIMDNP